MHPHIPGACDSVHFGFLIGLELRLPSNWLFRYIPNANMSVVARVRIAARTH